MDLVRQMERKHLTYFILMLYFFPKLVIPTKNKIQMYSNNILIDPLTR